MTRAAPDRRIAAHITRGAPVGHHGNDERHASRQPSYRVPARNSRGKYRAPSTPSSVTAGPSSSSQGWTFAQAAEHLGYSDEATATAQMAYDSAVVSMILAGSERALAARMA